MAPRKGPAGPPPAPQSDPSPAGAPGGVPAPSFEEALERLETIVEELEGGSLSLEESIARYEEGVKLSRRLTQTLDEAEKRIERLVEAEDPAAPPVTQPMELEENAADVAPASSARARGPAGPASEEELPF